MRNAYNYGMDAEKMVIEHYTAMGFELVRHRYKTPYGEIDIIMKDSKSVVFIEVKARTNPKHEEFLTQKQIKRCCDAALHFISNGGQGWLDEALRFDLVVVINNRIEKIFENAWDYEY